MIADLRDASQARDAERFRRAAHSLKSNANTFGASTLGAMARELELGGLPVDPSGGAAALDALEEAYGRAAGALRELCHA
jgi:HPt (histidine-containing phosphotransfer) domain-containing protein